MRFYAGGAAMFAEESGLRGAGAPDCRRLRHDGVVQEALRQRRARQPLAGKTAQFIVTSTVGDDVGDDGQPCAAKAIDVMTRKSCPRFSGGKSYQPRRLSKDVTLFIFHRDRFPEPEKIKRVRRDCRPGGPNASVEDHLVQAVRTAGVAVVLIRRDRRRVRLQASGPERMSGLGVPRSEAGIYGASVGGAAIAGSGSDAHARPCLKLSRRVLATRASRVSVHPARRTRRLGSTSAPSSCSCARARSRSSSPRDRASCCARACRR